MDIFGRSLHELLPQDLYAAIGTAGENMSLDFKRECYGNSDQDKREFAKDVCGLANGVGGHLFIGIDEEDGVASRIVPIVDVDIDKEILRLDSIIRDGIEPRPLGVDFLPVDVEGGRVLVIHVPASWYAPHRVNMRSNQFFVRRSRSTDPMSVQEIRDMILRTLNREAVADEFRERRFAEIYPERTSGAFNEGCTFALHIVPMAPGKPRLDVQKAMTISELVPPFGGDGYRLKPNFYGAGSTVDQHASRKRAQIFRDGCFEAAVLFNCTRHVENVDYSPISGWVIIEVARKDVPKYMRGLSKLGYDPPYAIYFSLGRAQNRGLFVSEDQFQRPPRISELDRLQFEAVFLEYDDIRSEADAIDAFRPALDQIWQSFGMPCFSY